MSTKTPIKVYDLESDSDIPNFILGNGVVVHNSKDIADAVCGSVYNLYQHLDVAGQLSNRYIANKGSEALKERAAKPTDVFQGMVQDLFRH